jgi:hypothetical protein
MWSNEQLELLGTAPGENQPPKRRIAKGFLAAYRAGRKAARKYQSGNRENGKAETQKPYPPYKARNDWRRVFRHYWTEGFADEERGRGERYE